MFERDYEDYQIGDKWSSRGRTITESDLVQFASFSGDWYPLHTDKEWAGKTQFGQRIAHGLLVLSVSMGLTILKPGCVVAYYGIDKLRFTHPTYIGDTIHLELEIVEKVDKGQANGVVVARAVVKKQTEEPVLVAMQKLLIAKRQV